MDWQVTGVSQDRDITITFMPTACTAEAAAGVDPAALAEAQQAVGRWCSGAATVTMSNRGVVRETHLAVHAISDPQARERASALFAPSTKPVVWPEEAVGVGARWTARQTETNDGVVMFATDYEVLSIEGSSVTVTARTAITTSHAGLTESAYSKSTLRLDSMDQTSEIIEWSTMALTSPDQPEEVTIVVETRASVVPAAPDASPQSSSPPAEAADRQGTPECRSPLLTGSW